ncbi:MAG TPA: TraR/DksA C4-type zinc finger protein [Anaerolineae bacterium]|nr:TraR/DksA C4-type zinc finger protein [Anaerolineae bacterium]
MIDYHAIRAQLCAERDELRQRVQIPWSLVKGDEVDIANLMLMKEDTLWVSLDAQQRMAAIEKALGRIEQGTYGECLNCAKPIPAERLAAMLLTQYCVSCQTRLERTCK